MSRPTILAVESSCARSAVALLAGANLLAEETFARGSGGRGAASPAAAAQRALAAAGRRTADVDLLAASVGPGSYTGLRVGVSFAKCFAWALNLPAVAVSSLLALAAEVPAGDGLLVPVTNAFRGQVFARAFRPEADGALAALTPDLVLAPAELGPALATACGTGEAALIFGPGVARWSREIAAGLDAGLRAELRDGPGWPRARTVGRIGARLFAAGKAVTAHDLAPLYLRKTEAEERLENGPPG
jgi:tRNA threonylcarbamoyladenosine biosynthesis protein TsaB